jgi:vancomycin resistance protein YoaR
MQATRPYPTPASGNSPARKLGYFFIPPLIGLALLALLLGALLTTYQARHSGRILTGVSVYGVDLSQMTPDEAATALAQVLTYSREGQITLVNPITGEKKTYAPAELGIVLDVSATAEAAYAIGRDGNPLQRLQDSFQSWYYGREVAPVIVFDEGRLDQAISPVVDAIEQDAVSATLDISSGTAAYTPSQVGRFIDRVQLREGLAAAAAELRPAEVELLVHEVVPPVYDSPQTAERISGLLTEPIRFYFPQPLADLDLDGVTLTPEEMAAWTRVELVTLPDGRQEHRVFIDENAARNWLAQFNNRIYREPTNARFYFNDDTRELVLVSPHTNGRELDIDATVAGMTANLAAGNHEIPLVMRDIVPVVNANATAAELGITELITETTTWFYGSSDERKHNIARAAANFYGIVVAPGEEFSFNRYLGSISEADGYEEGLIIVGGRTIKGVGGGVCQVSTTLYQTAFWSGFPIVERWEHGYMVNYYNDGEGPGMDATVFSPIVDFRFINNTPHHLLIENYYNEEFQSLTFKFYSTSLGRTVLKEEPVFTNETPAPEDDIWEFDPELPEGTVAQYDYATGGATVSVKRTVLNAEGQTLEERVFESNYIPWPNVYRYGPGVTPGDYSLVPDNE